MKKKSVIQIFLMISILFLQVHSVHAEKSEEPWAKYPDNSQLDFEDVDSFYDKYLDEKIYLEYENAKLNIREKTTFKDINKMKEKADKYGQSRSGGMGVHPNRQVYVFVTVSQDEEMKTAVFDAETKRPLNYDGPLEK
ncbi:hypothetical protein [Alkalihalobacillus sp. 1P02AB]|uniref:hypothetical protein n=1 Tax=Alkalihalobacillus sp. 1P02AB TaxID=3132260 RepID=UPI0039A60863